MKNLINTFCLENEDSTSEILIKIFQKGEKFKYVILEDDEVIAESKYHFKSYDDAEMNARIKLFILDE